MTARTNLTQELLVNPVFGLCINLCGLHLILSVGKTFDEIQRFTLKIFEKSDL